MSRLTKQLRLQTLWLVRAPNGTAKLYSDSESAQQAGKAIGYSIWKTRVQWRAIKKMKQ